MHRLQAELEVCMACDNRVMSSFKCTHPPPHWGGGIAEQGAKWKPVAAGQSPGPSCIPPVASLRRFPEIVTFPQGCLSRVCLVTPRVAPQAAGSGLRSEATRAKPP